MAKVVGIGGVFFRARDPEALSAWYGEYLGLNIQPTWHGAIFPIGEGSGQSDGYQVWSPMAQDTTYLGDNPQAMLNLRVDDLDGLLTALRASGCSVESEERRDPNFGHFAWVTDPEGHRIELWQPPAKSMT